MSTSAFRLLWVTFIVVCGAFLCSGVNLAQKSGLERRMDAYERMAKADHDDLIIKIKEAEQATEYAEQLQSDAKTLQADARKSKREYEGKTDEVKKLAKELKAMLLASGILHRK